MTYLDSGIMHVYASSETDAKVVFMALLFHFGDGLNLTSVELARAALASGITSSREYVAFAFDAFGYGVDTDEPVEVSTSTLEAIRLLLGLAGNHNLQTLSANHVLHVLRG